MPEKNPTSLLPKPLQSPHPIKTNKPHSRTPLKALLGGKFKWVQNIVTRRFGRSLHSRFSTINKAPAPLLEGLRLYELARFIVNLPSAFLLAMFKATFVPELAIGMVSLPFTVLPLFIVEAARPPGLAILEEPCPLTNNLSVLDSYRRTASGHY